MAEAATYQYDVFISYSHRDQVWVTSELLPRLKQVGLQVCIDGVHFEAGGASQINMAEKVQQSRRLIAVLTQAWVQSDWSQYEALIAAQDDPIGTNRRLIFLKREPCEVPAHFRPLTFVDFQSIDEDSWQHLLTQLSPSPHSSSVVSTPRTPSLPERNPFLGESPYLLGRDQELRRIKEKLQAGNHCSIVGPLGSGRSHLVREVHKNLSSWLGCPPQAVLLIPFRGINSVRELQEIVVQALGGRKATEWRSLLRTKPLRLLMLDDLGVMDPGERGLAMRSWLRGLDDNYGTKLLMVSNERLEVLFRKDDPTRDSPLAGLDPLPIQLPPLSAAVCRQLMQQRLRDTSVEIDLFADIFQVSHQPKELFNLGAQRYETLR